MSLTTAATPSTSSASPSPGARARSLSRSYTTPAPAPGFIGEGHTAVEVLRPDALADSDPFVLLMDDRLDIRTRRQIGGAHPHAGLETVTLVLDGVLSDRDEGELRAGDVIWMTAGSGIVHNESVEAAGRSRILQLWIGLSSNDRFVAPGFQIIRRDAAPALRAPGVEGRLYSGASGSQRAATRNRVPVTLVDLTLGPGAQFHQDLPGSYNGFVYVVDGDVGVGSGAERLTKGQVGWLAPAPLPVTRSPAGGAPASASATEVVLSAGERGGRLVLYAGEPIGEPLVQQGPFVAGTRAEILEFHHRFRAGTFASMSQLARAQRAERRSA